MADKATPEEVERERDKMLEMLKKMGYEPEAVRASGGEWDGRECLANERATMAGREFGIILTLKDCEAVDDLREVPGIVADVERTGARAVAAIVDHAKGGGLWVSVLYASQYAEEWPAQERALEACEPWAQVATPDNYYEAEEGDVGIKIAFGGLVRTW